ncbi:MAG: hypothetical protein PHF17_08385 [Arcobacteraceae bacterium]|nr:hypothetical protein [Arcobacteraceae bacterium]
MQQPINKEKFDFYINELKTRFKKEVLNAKDVYKLIGISAPTFAKYVENQEFNSIPKFKKTIYKRADGQDYIKYKFNLYDVAEFLAK